MLSSTRGQITLKLDDIDDIDDIAKQSSVCESRPPVPRKCFHGDYDRSLIDFELLSI